MLTGHGIGIFNGEGLVASHAAIFPIGLARAGDGSLLIANDYGRVIAITEAGSALAAVAITGTRVSPRRLTVEFTSTVAGRAHLAVAGREVDTVVRPGRATLTVRVAAKPGVHRVELAVRAPPSTVAVTNVGVLNGPLRAGVARHAVYRYADATQEGNGHVAALPRVRCPAHRLRERGRRRVLPLHGCDHDRRERPRPLPQLRLLTTRTGPVPAPAALVDHRQRRHVPAVRPAGRPPRPASQ